MGGEDSTQDQSFPVSCSGTVSTSGASSREHSLNSSTGSEQACCFGISAALSIDLPKQGMGASPAGSKTSPLSCPASPWVSKRLQMHQEMRLLAADLPESNGQLYRPVEGVSPPANVKGRPIDGSWVMAMTAAAVTVWGQDPAAVPLLSLALATITQPEYTARKTGSRVSNYASWAQQELARAAHATHLTVQGLEPVLTSPFWKVVPASLTPEPHHLLMLQVQPLAAAAVEAAERLGQLPPSDRASAKWPPWLSPVVVGKVHRQAHDTLKQVLSQATDETFLANCLVVLRDLASPATTNSAAWPSLCDQLQTQPAIHVQPSAVDWKAHGAPLPSPTSDFLSKFQLEPNMIATRGRPAQCSVCEPSLSTDASVIDTWKTAVCVGAMSVWGVQHSSQHNTSGEHSTGELLFCLAMGVLTQPNITAKLNGGIAGTRLEWSEMELIRAAAAVGGTPALKVQAATQLLQDSPHWVVKPGDSVVLASKQSVKLQVSSLAAAAVQAADKQRAGLPFPPGILCARWPPRLQLQTSRRVLPRARALLEAASAQVADLHNAEDFLRDCLVVLRDLADPSVGMANQAAWPCLQRTTPLAAAARTWRAGSLSGSEHTPLTSYAEPTHVSPPHTSTAASFSDTWVPPAEDWQHAMETEADRKLHPLPNRWIPTWQQKLLTSTADAGSSVSCSVPVSGVQSLSEPGASIPHVKSDGQGVSTPGDEAQGDLAVGNMSDMGDMTEGQGSLAVGHSDEAHRDGHVLSMQADECYLPAQDPITYNSFSTLDPDLLDNPEPLATALPESIQAAHVASVSGEPLSMQALQAGFPAAAAVLPSLTPFCPAACSGKGQGGSSTSGSTCDRTGSPFAPSVRDSKHKSKSMGAALPSRAQLVDQAANKLYANPVIALHQLRQALVRLLYETGPTAAAGPYTVPGPEVGIYLKAKLSYEWKSLSGAGSKLVALCEGEPWLILISVPGNKHVALDVPKLLSAAGLGKVRTSPTPATPFIPPDVGAASAPSPQLQPQPQQTAGTGSNATSSTGHSLNFTAKTLEPAIRRLYPGQDPDSLMRRYAVSLLLDQGKNNNSGQPYAMMGQYYGAAIAKTCPAAWHTLPTGKRLSALCDGDPVLRTFPYRDNSVVLLNMTTLLAALPAPTSAPTEQLVLTGATPAAPLPVPSPALLHSNGEGTPTLGTFTTTRQASTRGSFNMSAVSPARVRGEGASASPTLTNNTDSIKVYSSGSATPHSALGPVKQLTQGQGTISTTSVAGSADPPRPHSAAAGRARDGTSYRVTHPGSAQPPPPSAGILRQAASKLHPSSTPAPLFAAAVVEQAAAKIYSDPANPVHRLRKALVQLLLQVADSAGATGQCIAARTVVGDHLQAQLPHEWETLEGADGQLVALCQGEAWLCVVMLAGERAIAMDVPKLLAAAGMDQPLPTPQIAVSTNAATALDEHQRTQREAPSWHVSPDIWLAVKSHFHGKGEDMRMKRRAISVLVTQGEENASGLPYAMTRQSLLDSIKWPAAWHDLSDVERVSALCTSDRVLHSFFGNGSWMVQLDMVALQATLSTPTAAMPYQASGPTDASIKGESSGSNSSNGSASIPAAPLPVSQHPVVTHILGKAHSATTGTTTTAVKADPPPRPSSAAASSKFTAATSTHRPQPSAGNLKLAASKMYPNNSNPLLRLRLALVQLLSTAESNAGLHTMGGPGVGSALKTKLPQDWESLGGKSKLDALCKDQPWLAVVPHAGNKAVTLDAHKLLAAAGMSKVCPSPTAATPITPPAVGAAPPSAAQPQTQASVASQAAASTAPATPLSRQLPDAHTCGADQLGVSHNLDTVSPGPTSPSYGPASPTFPIFDSWATLNPLFGSRAVGGMPLLDLEPAQSESVVEQPSPRGGTLQPAGFDLAVSELIPSQPCAAPATPPQIPQLTATHSPPLTSSQSSAPGMTQSLTTAPLLAPHEVSPPEAAQAALQTSSPEPPAASAAPPVFHRESAMDSVTRAVVGILAGTGSGPLGPHSLLLPQLVSLVSSQLPEQWAAVVAVTGGDEASVKALCALQVYLQAAMAAGMTLAIRLDLDHMCALLAMPTSQPSPPAVPNPPTPSGVPATLSPPASNSPQAAPSLQPQHSAQALGSASAQQPYHAPILPPPGTGRISADCEVEDLMDLLMQ